MIRRVGRKLRSIHDAHRSKGYHELRFWNGKAAVEGTLANDHYEELFTAMFGLDRSFYTDKRILDIGCGPRGSLEWADKAAERVGLDPLADDYRRFGIERHAMTYVCSGVERIPFSDAYFDVVTSLNSLDHVDELDAALREISRITAPGGAFLLEVEIGHDPTYTEPKRVWLDIFDTLAPYFSVVSDRRFEIPPDDVFTHAGWRTDWGGPLDVSKGVHPGVLVAHCERRPG